MVWVYFKKLNYLIDENVIDKTKKQLLELQCYTFNNISQINGVTSGGKSGNVEHMNPLLKPAQTSY